MNQLTHPEASRVREIVFKIQQKKITNKDMKEFLGLVRKVSSDDTLSKLDDYVKKTGDSSIEELERDLERTEISRQFEDKRGENVDEEAFWDGFAKLGIGILLGYLLEKMFEDKE